MSDETDQDFDPRFDPAFQRGFDPAIPVKQAVPRPKAAPAPVAVQPAPAAVQPPPVIAHPPSSFAPQPVAPVVPPAPAQAAASISPHVGLVEPTAVAPDATPVQDADDDATPAASAPTARNPFLLALGVIAIVLIVVGVVIFVQSGSQFNSREVRSQGDYMSLDATIHMAPFISLLGAATAVGVLFVFAAKWRRRK
jgi:hypothetical protein